MLRADASGNRKFKAAWAYINIFVVNTYRQHAPVALCHRVHTILCWSLNNALLVVGNRAFFTGDEGISAKDCLTASSNFRSADHGVPIGRAADS